MRARILVVAVVVALCWFVTPASAEKGDMRIQFGVLQTSPTDELAQDDGTTELDGALGIQLGFEYMVNDSLGIEPVLTRAEHDVEFETILGDEFLVGEIGFLSVGANLNFHVRGDSKVDVYLGPTIRYVLWDDLETDLFGPAEEIAAEDELAFGANLGVEVPFGDGNWGFSGGLTYLFQDVTLESDLGTAVQPDLGLDPYQFRVAVSYSF